MRSIAVVAGMVVAMILALAILLPFPSGLTPNSSNSATSSSSTLSSTLFTSSSLSNSSQVMQLITVVTTNMTIPDSNISRTITSMQTTSINKTPTNEPRNGSITVLGETLDGTSHVNGIEVDLRINGTDVAIGSTPVTFHNLQLGVQYGVVVYWYGADYVRYINDSNTGIDLQRYDLVTLNQSSPSDTLTAMFEVVPASQAASLNIIAEYPNGTLIGTTSVVNNYVLHSSGMWLTVTPPFQSKPYTGTFTGGSILPFILFNHETYTIQMTELSCGPEQNLNGQSIGIVENVWSHWENTNSANSSATITLNGSETLIAIYNQVTQASCPVHSG